jgi:hypothetical protein
LESTAAGVADTWTKDRIPTFATRNQTLAGGGGTQYIIPDPIHNLKLISKP